MTEAALSQCYRDYIACLNGRDWDNLKQFVSDAARHNGRPFGLLGYRAMLERDFSGIPDLRFNIELMFCSNVQFDVRLEL
jgi:predicted ester cyclase